MRALMLAAAAALSLSACGSDQAAQDTSNLDEALVAEEIVSNDATAIDAATGADANMAEDVVLNVPFNAVDNDSDAADNEAVENAE